MGNSLLLSLIIKKIPCWFQKGQQSSSVLFLSQTAMATSVSQWHGCPKTKTRQRWNLQNQDKTKTRQKESVLDPRQDKTKTRLVLVLSWFFQDRVCLVLVLSWFSKTETVLSWSCLGLGPKTKMIVYALIISTYIDVIRGHPQTT